MVIYLVDALLPSHPTKVIPTDSLEKLLERKHITRLTSYAAPSGSGLFPTGYDTSRISAASPAQDSSLPLLLES